MTQKKSCHEPSQPGRKLLQLTCFNSLSILYHCVISTFSFSIIFKITYCFVYLINSNKCCSIFLSDSEDMRQLENKRQKLEEESWEKDASYSPHTLNEVSSPQLSTAHLGEEIGHILNNASTPGAREQQPIS